MFNRNHCLTVLPVVDGYRFVGIVTAKELLDPELFARPAVCTSVWEIMTPELVCCPKDYTLEQAATLMRSPVEHSRLKSKANKTYSQLPVLKEPFNNIKNLIGMVYRVDVLEALLARNHIHTNQPNLTYKIG